MCPPVGCEEGTVAAVLLLGAFDPVGDVRILVVVELLCGLTVGLCCCVV